MVQASFSTARGPTFSMCYRAPLRSVHRTEAMGLNRCGYSHFFHAASGIPGTRNRALHRIWQDYFITTRRDDDRQPLRRHCL